MIPNFLTDKYKIKKSHDHDLLLINIKNIRLRFMTHKY